MALAKAYLTAGDVHLTLPVNVYSAQWGYQHNTSSTDTLGGRVVQLLSVLLTDLSVTSVAGSRKELQKMADGIRAIMDYHIRTSLPARFVVPSRAWRFSVFLKAMPQIGWDVAATTYPYQLAMSMVEDLNGVKTRQVTKAALGNLADGIGYNPAVHGGLTNAFSDLVDTVLKLAPATTTTSGSSGTGSAPGESGVNPDKGHLDAEELAQLSAWALGKEIPDLSPSDLTKNTIYAVAVALCESGGYVGNTNANATNGTAIGLWQAAAGQNGFTAAELSTAEGNARWMAIELKTDYTCSVCNHGNFGIRTWEGAWYSYWGCFRGEGAGYQTHMTEARNAVRNAL